jgi:hypothetical protein
MTERPVVKWGDTTIIVMAGLVAISASLAGISSSDAGQEYALGISSLQYATADESWADRTFIRDEQLIIQTLVAIQQNDTELVDFLIEGMSEEAVSYVNYTTLEFSDKYFDTIFEKSDARFAEAADHFRQAEDAKTRSDALLVVSASMSGAIVAFTELTRSRKPKEI